MVLCVPVSEKDKKKVIEALKHIKDTVYAIGKQTGDLLIVSTILSKFIPHRLIIYDHPDITKYTMAVDGRYLYINKRFWDSLEFDDKVAVSVHEALHIFLYHPERSFGKEHDIWNVAGDARINWYIKDTLALGKKLWKNAVTPENLIKYLKKQEIPDMYIWDKDKIKRASDDELYAYLLYLKKRFGTKIGVGRVGKEVCEEGKECVPIPRDILRPGKIGPGELPEEAQREAKRTGLPPVSRGDIERAVAEARRVAGQVGGTSREFELIGKDKRKKVDWRKILRNAFSSVGTQVISTWKRPSRRHPSYPGIKFLGYPKVLLLIDVSGSISNEDMTTFINEIMTLVKTYNLKPIAYLWSDKVVDKRILRSASDVLGLKYVPESGGTQIYPALSEAVKVADNNTVVVVFSDGFIFDIEKFETVEAIKKIKSNANKSAFISVGQIPEQFKVWDYALLLKSEK